MQCAAAFAVVLSLTAFAQSSAAAQITAFTYQGSLDDDGAPASGLHDLRFLLFNAATGGVVVGTPACVNDVNVDDGVFTVELDFGSQYASLEQRYLEIYVRNDTGLSCGDLTGFVPLTPRQRLTATPMASHANSAYALDAADGFPTNAVFVDAAGNVGVGTTAPTNKLDVRAGSILVENVGDQADLLWLASERSWVFRQEGTGSATALKLENVGGGGNKNFVVQTTGFMGVGTTTPAAKLDVRGDIKLGSSGQYQAAAGNETLRLVRGTVRDNGGIIAGTGFTVQRVLPGWYTMTFTTPFSGIPSATATARTGTGSVPLFTNTFLVTANSFVVHVKTAAGAIIDSEFDFCVMGPR
jgi:hypothetical protein